MTTANDDEPGAAALRALEASIYEGQPLTDDDRELIEECARRWAEIKAAAPAKEARPRRPRKPPKPRKPRSSRSVWAIPTGFETNRRRH
jgi:hypothetical protein